MILETFLKWLIPVVCGGVLGCCVTYMKMRKKRETALENGVQCLLRAKIIDEYNKYLHKGYCPIYAKESAKRMYSAYHELGGNDVATSLYEKIIEMPEEEPEGGEGE